MNSYPLELLAQLAPVMFVAGLDPPSPPKPQSPSNSQSPPSPAPVERTSSSRPQDPFTVLSIRLRDALLAQRKVGVWQPEKHKIFQVVLVDKDVRFPPRKLVPPEDPQYSSAHSPLSPLTPSSPLHPDGLIAPIWIRKHTTLVPSVFVLFKRLFEYPPHNPTSPLDAPDHEREKEKDQEERRRDTELAAEIAQRKKSTNERGIKLTVVLMASRKMLDDPSLDTRLTYIRRQSGLDSRAALFVLSPVSQSELGDFIRSLQQALYEPALEYYTSHSKRVRRKRNRHSQAVSSYPNPLSPLGSAGAARPLRPEGWTVRYEYKMACFAEFRGEDEVALKHYQDAYEMLVIMFGSTVILPPRTKRWAEAKVLADCINVKITKLYLYNNEHALALSHHNTHIRKFGDFSRGWGIGEETFEYWSWVARQHRILAELLEYGTRSNLVIPVHRPVVSSSAISNATLSTQPGAAARGPIPGMELESMRSLGINPNHALQHPGFYYYMAARCTESRRERYLAALEAEERDRVPSTSPGFANEKKVDHLTIILELYTKSYELFKQHTPDGQGQGRLPLWIAYRIAQTYYDSGKFDLAVRFFERIAKAYRREQWVSMLRPLLSTWYACAQQLGDVELSVRLLVEMLGHGARDSDEPGSLEEDLLAVLESTVPSTQDEAFVIDNSEFQPIFDTNLVFWTPEVKVGELAAFQLSLTAPADVTISSLPITSMEVHFSESVPPFVIHHVEEPAGGSSSSVVRTIDLGHVRYNPGGEGVSNEVEANLRWMQGQKVIFMGTMSSDAPTSFTISHLVMKLVRSAWNIEILLHPCKSHQDSPPVGCWLSSLSPLRFIPLKREDFSSVDVRHRPHTVLVSLSHQSPAYLNEEFPIDIKITNADDKELEVSMDILLQPTEVDFAINTVYLDEQQSNAMIKGISFGLLPPGASLVKTLYLLNTGAAGDRMIDISIQSRCQTNSEDIEPELQDATETLKTVVIPTVEPLKATSTVTYRRATKASLGLADLRGYESDYWDDTDGGEAIVQTVFECVGPWNLEVESFVLQKREHPEVKILSSSTEDEDDMFPSEYETSDEFSDICRVSIGAPLDNQDGERMPIPSPGEYHVTWRRLLSDGKQGSTGTSVFPLPLLQPPTDELIALLDVPPLAKLHQPIPLTLTIRNRHTSRTANVTVQLEPDPSDSFVVAGLRTGRVPILLPGSEEKLLWKLIPIECGYVKVPKIKVMDRRKTVSLMPGGTDVDGGSDGTIVKVVDIRLDQRRGEPEEGIDEDTEPSELKDRTFKLVTVLVLP